MKKLDFISSDEMPLNCEVFTGQTRQQVVSVTLRKVNELRTAVTSYLDFVNLVESVEYCLFCRAEPIDELVPCSSNATVFCLFLY